MLKVVNGEARKTRKLILGFDAGCGTCADLAAGVQEKVGDKLEVQNLNDPQLLAWREEVLGKDAKWTPTLFEVEGEKVLKAWAGWRMGYALSRKLGPSSTWQVMQALGEVGGALKVEESSIVEKLPGKAAEAVVGMSRGQFIKGVGGAAVAASVLSSGLLFPSEADAATSTGTLAQQRLAKSIVRSSAVYKTMASKQDQIGARFVFSQAVVRVYRAFTSVSIYSPHRRRGMAVTFYISLSKKRVLQYNLIQVVPYGEQRFKAVRQVNGRILPRPYQQIIVGANSVVTGDGRKMSLEQFKRWMSNSTGSMSAQATQAQYNACLDNARRGCADGAGIGLCAAGGAVVGGLSSIVLTPGGGYVVGTGTGALCAYGVNNYVCPGLPERVCADQKPSGPPPPVPAPRVLPC